MRQHVMHGNSKNRIPLVYDLMELLRPVVDHTILKFALSNRFMPGNFAINRFWGGRLNPQMTKVVASKATAISDNRVVTDFIKRLN